MNITYIGLDNECSTKLCNYLSKSHSVSLITNRKPLYEIDCQTIVEKSLWVPHYLEKKEVEIILYNDVNDNYTLLNNWMTYAVGKVKYFVVIRQDRLAKSNSSVMIEQLLKTAYSKNSTTKISILNSSALYGTETAPEGIKNIVSTIIKNNTIDVPDGFPDVCDSLHIEDFCTFVENYIEKIEEITAENIYIQSGYLFQAKDLFYGMKKHYPQAEISFDAEFLSEKVIQDAIHLDGWSPKHSFIEEIDDVLNKIEDKFEMQNVKKRKERFNVFEKYVVVIIGFLAVEFYTHFMSVPSDMQFVDLRLALIAIIAIAMGKKYAVITSLLCGFGSAMQCLAKGYRWHILFFNVNNWIPIIIYIVFAILLGAYSNKLREERISR